MKAAQCYMGAEAAPPGFWRRSFERPLLVDGVELHSEVPTRFFQTVDAYPAGWGRLIWRLQINKIVAGQAVSPAFRTFYPGVEWNLNRPDYRWFLTAWFTWEGPGPPDGDARLPAAAHLEDDTALFRIASTPALFLRSRVDARDRRSISESLQAQRKPRTESDPALISLDDIIETPG